MANHRVVGPELEKEVVRLHQEGHAISVIARTLGVKPKTMLETVRRLGLPITRHHRRSGATAQQIQEMATLYQQGSGTKELGAMYDLSDQTVARYLRETGVEVRPAGFQRGEAHHAWVGGRHIAEDGYVRIWLTDDDPMYAMAQAHSKHGGYCLEHRLVVARHLGRPLTEDETVHHIDNNPLNNSLENLQLRQGRHGKGAVLQCADCGSHNIIPRPIAGMS
jgi:hypothetical protein